MKSTCRFLYTLLCHFKWLWWNRLRNYIWCVKILPCYLYRVVFWPFFPIVKMSPEGWANCRWPFCPMLCKAWPSERNRAVVFCHLQGRPAKDLASSNPKSGRDATWPSAVLSRANVKSWIQKRLRLGTQTWLWNLTPVPGGWCLQAMGGGVQLEPFLLETQFIENVNHDSQPNLFWSVKIAWNWMSDS